MKINADWYFSKNADWGVMRNYRLNRLIEGIKRNQLDALLMTRLDTIRYSTSFRPVYSMWFHGIRHIVILTKEGKISFLVASGDYDRVQNTMPWIKDVTPVPFLIEQGVSIVLEAIKRMDVTKGKIGVDMLPFNLYKPLSRELPNCEFVDGSKAIDFARKIKCKEEIKCLRAAAKMADLGMHTVLDNLKEGNREIDAAAAQCKAITEAGSEDIAYLPLVEAGEHGWLGYKIPTEYILKKGDMVYVDTGNCIVNGYNGDIARIGIIGRASPFQAKIYRTCYEMLQQSIKQLTPGNSTKQVLDVAEEIARKSGFAENIYFGILGHGIGTDLHEAPTIGEKVTGIDKGEILEAGMVICLEPGILVPNIGGGHLEDMILITESGPEVLTRTPFMEDLLE